MPTSGIRKTSPPRPTAGCFSPAQPPSPGGEKAGAGDVSYNLPVFQALKLRLSFWDADDEFPASLSLLWDENVLDFMRYETTFYAAGYLLDRLSGWMNRI